MKLVPREIEKLMLHNAGVVAQKRLARAQPLNYTEAVALIATQVSHNPNTSAFFSNEIIPANLGLSRVDRKCHSCSIFRLFGND